MRKLLSALALSTIAFPALADDRPVNQREYYAITWAIGAYGCKGGRYEYDRDDYRYEVDDARCADGREYDFELDRQFRIIKRERD